MLSFKVHKSILSYRLVNGIKKPHPGKLAPIYPSGRPGRGSRPQ